MDPNEALRQIRRLLEELPEQFAGGNPADVFEAADLGRILAEHVAALDGWISGGGFLPDDWARLRAVR